MLKETVVLPASPDAYTPRVVEEGSPGICATYRDWNLRGFYFEKGRGWLSPFVKTETAVCVPTFDETSDSLLRQDIERQGGKIIPMGGYDHVAYLKFQMTVLDLDDEGPCVHYATGCGSTIVGLGLSAELMSQAQEATRLNGEIVRWAQDRDITALCIKQRFDFHGMTLTRKDLEEGVDAFWEKMNGESGRPVIPQECRDKARSVIQRIPDITQHFL